MRDRNCLRFLYMKVSGKLKPTIDLVNFFLQNGQLNKTKSLRFIDTKKKTTEYTNKRQLIGDAAARLNTV